MYLLIDGQALQAASWAQRRHMRSLLALLAAQQTRGWRVELVQDGDRVAIPFHALPRTLPVRGFHPLRGPGRQAAALHYADWLCSLGADAILFLDPLAPGVLVPRFLGQHPRLAVYLPGAPSRLDPITWPKASSERQAIAHGVRLTLSADCLVLPSNRAVREAQRLLRSEQKPACFSFKCRSRAQAGHELLQVLVGKVRVHNPAPVRPPRRRIAWVSPLPPSGTGIADYSAELLPLLAEHYQLDLVLSPERTFVPSQLAQAHELVPAAQIAARHAARPYDLFVHQLGNSIFHLYQLDLLRRYHGLLVLHDYYVGTLMIDAIRLTHGPDRIVPELARLLETEGEQDLAQQLRAGNVGPGEVDRLVPLNGKLLSWSDGIIVHSRWSWQRARRRATVPVAHIPLYIPRPRRETKVEGRQRLGLPAEAFLVSTLGLVAPNKRIPSLLRAVAQLPQRVRANTVLVVVGPVDAALQAELQAEAERLGIGAQVRFPGRVPLEDLGAYGYAADVCVQLRYPTRGETSAALLRALAAGATCVVSDDGAFSEYPDNVVLKVGGPASEVEELTAVLVRLYDDPALRDSLGQQAARYVHIHNDFSRVVCQYRAMIEATIAFREGRDAVWCEAVQEQLALLGPAAGSLPARWAALRSRGQAPAPLSSMAVSSGLPRRRRVAVRRPGATP